MQTSLDYRTACLEFDDAKVNAAVAEKALKCNTAAVARLSEQDEPDVLHNLNKANDKVGLVTLEGLMQYRSENWELENITRSLECNGLNYSLILMSSKYAWLGCWKDART